MSVEKGGRGAEKSSPKKYSIEEGSYFFRAKVAKLKESIDEHSLLDELDHDLRKMLESMPLLV